MERRLAAILAADVVGYSRLIGIDEAGTLSSLKAHREELIEPKIAEHNGRIVKLMGDGLLAEFPSAVEAVRCAVQIQHFMAERNATVLDDRRITFRIGINIGDIVVEGDDIYGDGVNVAARLEGVAEPGGICARRNVRNQVRDKLDVEFEDLGEIEVKNITRPVRAFRVVLDAKSAALLTPVVPTPAKAIPRLPIVRAAGLVLLLIAVGGILWWQPWAPDVEPASITKMALPLPEQPSIAVLPFDNFSNDPEQDFLADGLTEEIITALSKTPELFVIARNSTFIYKDKSVPVRQVAEEQGVRYVLEGSVQRSGERIRINAQLIDALEGNHIWAERYDREFEDLFSLQDDITHNVATALQVTLTLGDEVSSRRRGTSSPEAFQLAHKALWHIQQYNKEDTAKARELVKRAQEIAPDALFPLQMEGWVHLNDARFGYTASKEESLAKAKAIAKRALLIDENDPDSHLLLAGVERGQKNLDEAIRHMERAIELNPNHAKAVGAMAQLLNYSGRPQEAIGFSKKAMRLSPVYPPWMPANLGLSYMMIGEYDKAIEAYEEVLSRGAFIVFGYERLAAIHALKGDLDRAREYASKLLEAKPDFTIEEWSNVLLYTNEEDLDRELNALRAAGLPERPPLELPDKPSIAVLPFDNLSGDPEQDYVVDGITDDIITAISKFHELFVISRNSSFSYKGKPIIIQQVAEELGVRYVLEGSFRKVGDDLRITAQLIDALNGNHVWAQTYDRDASATFAILDELVDAIVTALAIKVEEAERRRAVRTSTTSPKAYDYFLRGRDLQLRRGFWIKEVNQEVRRLQEQATDIDPQFSRAFSEQAWTHLYDFIFNWSEVPVQSRDRAFELARKAVSLEPSSARAHYVLGYTHLYAREHDLAMAEVEKALVLNPNDARLLAGSAGLSIYGGEPHKAIEQITAAMRLNPNHEDWYWHFLAWARFHAGMYEESIDAEKRVINPSAGDHRMLAAALVRLGRFEEASKHVSEVLRLEPNYVVSQARENLPYKNKKDSDAYLDALRLAGLPE
jgi:adenylate cyclase